MRYADVILPLATPPMTFAVDEAMRPGLRTGMRVMVQLGARKFYAGIVSRLHDEPPAYKTIKPIVRIVDEREAATPEQLRLWEWISSYYMCPPGMVMRAALPAKLKLDGYSEDETLRSGYRRIISAFERGQTDILIGTQMITKGFDFGNVSLVGILNADNLLNYPDFRAGERAFQLMMQVGGRAGRRSEQGTVVIQTGQPSHPVLAQVCSGDYEAMARMQLAERQSFLYPPYCRLISLTLRHRDRTWLWEAANRFGDSLRRVFGRRLLGPEAPPVDRIRGQYLVRFLLKIEKQSSAAEAKRLLAGLFDTLHRDKAYRAVELIPDVDPQ